MALDVISPFQSIYDLAEAEGYDVQYKRYKRGDVQAVENLVLRIPRGDVVKTEKDWDNIKELIGFYFKVWPDEAREFMSNVAGIRTWKKDGYSESRDTLHLGSMPPRLMAIIKLFFPYQKWDKTFSNKFVKKFKLFKVVG